MYVYFNSQIFQPYHNSIVEQGFVFIVNENNLICNEIDPVHVVLVVSRIPALYTMVK